MNLSACPILVFALTAVLCACRPSTQEASVADPGGDPSTQAPAQASAQASDDAAAKPTSGAAGTDGMPERPALKIATLDGTVYDLTAKRDRWVVVNFWATWCGPCLKEMPELDAFDAARPDVEVIGLAYEEIAPEEMRAFLRERPVRYPIAMIDTYDPPADLPTPRGLPMTYVIAPGGTVAKQFMGPVTRDELEALTATPPKTE